jgi:hypothetical protein
MAARFVILFKESADRFVNDGSGHCFYIAPTCRHVRFGSLGDIAACLGDVRFTPESGH